MVGGATAAREVAEGSAVRREDARLASRMDLGVEAAKAPLVMPLFFRHGHAASTSPVRRRRARLAQTAAREPGLVPALSERHLLRGVREHTKFYNEDRPHMSLEGDAPAGRVVELPAKGEVVAIPRLGGLHHRYTRRAA